MNRPSVWIVLIALFLSGCELSSDLQDDDIVAGVNLSELFAPPTELEESVALIDWSVRDVSASNVLLERESVVSVAGKDATVRIYSHDVAGARHYGAIVTPDGLDPASAPILVYSHGGDSGVSVDNEVLLLLSFFGDIVDNFVYVVPSFRDESLRFGTDTWTSEGPASPWDYDVDDALALVNVAIEVEPKADPNRIGVLGFSRGAGVGLLMDVRSEEIDQVLEFFGPTDFFGPFVQEVTREILLGQQRELPGLDYMESEYVIPYQNGEISLETVRSALVRRSPALFVEHLSKVELHHGTADAIVPVSQAQRLISAMEEAGKTEEEFEYFIYEGGDHNPLTLNGSLERARAFLLELLNS